MEAQFVYSTERVHRIAQASGQPVMCLQVLGINTANTLSLCLSLSYELFFVITVECYHAILHCKRFAEECGCMHSNSSAGVDPLRAGVWCTPPADLAQCEAWQHWGAVHDHIRPAAGRKSGEQRSTLLDADGLFYYAFGKAVDSNGKISSSSLTYAAHRPVCSLP
eukprot:scaffold19668_cov20-Prasinocladus_malaysianus.AAC.1